MKKFIFYFSILLLFFTSCSGLKKISNKKKDNYEKKEYETINTESLTKEKKKIIKDAEKYLGVPYQYAGITEKGFDCSGLVCKVFEENSLKLPRRSIDQSKMGVSISIKDTAPGDLLFFTTSGGGKVSHVGIVHHVKENGVVAFIHASTSKGVIISSLDEQYWKKAFLFAKRMR